MMMMMVMMKTMMMRMMRMLVVIVVVVVLAAAAAAATVVGCGGGCWWWSSLHCSSSPVPTAGSRLRPCGPSLPSPWLSSDPSSPPVRLLNHDELQATMMNWYIKKYLYIEIEAKWLRKMFKFRNIMAVAQKDQTSSVAVYVTPWSALLILPRFRWCRPSAQSCLL